MTDGDPARVIETCLYLYTKTGGRRMAKGCVNAGFPYGFEAGEEPISNKAEGAGTAADLSQGLRDHLDARVTETP